MRKMIWVVIFLGFLAGCRGGGRSTGLPYTYVYDPSGKPVATIWDSGNVQSPSGKPLGTVKK